MVVEYVYTPILPSWRGGATGVIAGASWPGLYVLPLGQVLIPCSVSFPLLIIDGELWAHEVFVLVGLKNDVSYHTATTSSPKSSGEFDIKNVTREICNKTWQTKRISVILHGYKLHFTKESKIGG